MPNNKRSAIVFNLIKSMTPSEKRYFKMFVSVFERKNKTYIKLYNAIDKQKIYDEKTLKEKFVNEPFVKHFAVVKNGLYNMLLKSLRFSHNNEDAYEIVSQYKSNAKILIRKGFFKEANLHLNKAMKTAEESELLTEQINIAELQLSQLTHIDYKDHKQEILEQKLRHPFIFLERLQDYFNYKSFSSQIDFVLLRNKIRTEEAQEELKTLINGPILTNNETSLTVSAKTLKHHAKLACYVSMKQYKKGFIESEILFNLTRTEAPYFQHKPVNNVSTYNNHLFTAIKVKSLAECERIAAVYKQSLINTKNKNIDLHDFEGRLFEVNYHFKMDYYLYRSEFKKIQPMLPELEKEFEKIENLVSPFLFIFYNYNIAYAHFGIGNFEITQNYLLKLLNYKGLKSRKDYFTAVHLLNLFNHYELGNYEHLSYQIKNTKQLIIRQDYFYKFESTSLELLSKLSKNIKDDKKQDILRKYLITFRELSTQACEKDAFEKLDLVWWLNWKMPPLTQHF